MDEIKVRELLTKLSDLRQERLDLFNRNEQDLDLTKVNNHIADAMNGLEMLYAILNVDFEDSNNLEIREQEVTTFIPFSKNNY